MKFKLPKSTLLEGLLTIQNIVGARPTASILHNALIKAEDGKLTMTTTDLDLTICCSIDAEIETTGSTTLPVKRFASIVRELPSGPIEVNVDGNDVAHLACGSSFYKIIGLEHSQFPPTPPSDDSKSYTIDRAVFADMLRKTSYATTADGRPQLNGVLLNFEDGKLTCVATDGRRLALIEHEVEFPSTNNVDVILPVRAINELLRILNGEGDLKISLTSNQALFEFDNTSMGCKLLEGTYPNFRQVVITQCDHRVSIPREEFLAVLRRIVLFTTESSNAMRLKFDDNLLTITASSPDVGEARESIVVKYNGPEITAIFNPGYMMDPLRFLTGDEVFLELNDAMSPGLIKSNIPFLYVLMPLRV